MRQKRHADPIVDQLLAEADSVTPEFSPQLHDQLVRQIRAEPAHVATQQTELFTKPIAMRWIASAAAIALLAITAWLCIPEPGTAPKPSLAVVQPKPPAAPEFRLSFPTLSEETQRSLANARYGYLDRDAMMIGHHMKDLLGALPEAPPRHE